MKKFFCILIVFFSFSISHAQELLANVMLNNQQVGGSNQQAYKTLEKGLRDFINNTSWTGKRLQNFEKIKCNFAIIITEKSGNKYKGNLVVQAVRPIFNTTYDSPLVNINDTKFSFEYTENENLIFNERQFSGKNLTDLIGFYVYMILGYDADSYKAQGGQAYFEKAEKIASNAQNQGYEGWSVLEGLKTRGSLIDNLLKPDMNTLRNVFYTYHRAGLDNLNNQDQSSAKKIIADALMLLKSYENSFQLSYPFQVFIETKKNEIFEIFNNGPNVGYNINDLRNLMIIFAPNDAETKWNKWK